MLMRESTLSKRHRKHWRPKYGHETTGTVDTRVVKLSHKGRNPPYVCVDPRLSRPWLDRCGLWSGACPPAADRCSFGWSPGRRHPCGGCPCPTPATCSSPQSRFSSSTSLSARGQTRWGSSSFVELRPIGRRLVFHTPGMDRWSLEPVLRRSRLLSGRRHCPGELRHCLEVAGSQEACLSKSSMLKALLLVIPTTGWEPHFRPELYLRVVLTTRESH